MNPVECFMYVFICSWNILCLHQVFVLPPPDDQEDWGLAPLLQLCHLLPSFDCFPCLPISGGVFWLFLQCLSASDHVLVSIPGGGHFLHLSVHHMSLEELNRTVNTHIHWKDLTNPEYHTCYSYLWWSVGWIHYYFCKWCSCCKVGMLHDDPIRMSSPPPPLTNDQGYFVLHFSYKLYENANFSIIALVRKPLFIYDIILWCEHSQIYTILIITDYQKPTFTLSLSLCFMKNDARMSHFLSHDHLGRVRSWSPAVTCTNWDQIHKISQGFSQKNTWYIQ